MDKPKTLFCLDEDNISEMEVSEKDDVHELCEKLKYEVQKYRYWVKRDVLTGIYNHQTFIKETENLIKCYSDEDFIIGVWNIDRFKAINELLGTTCGDVILNAFADCLKHLFHEKATYGRMEGDQFVTCCSEKFLLEHAREINDLIYGKVKWHDFDYDIQMHVGFYEIENKDEDVSIMCDWAMLAMQAIKDSFMVRTNYFDATLRQNLIHEERMMKGVDLALQNREFFVVYQPIVDVATGKIVAAEALVRWKKADGSVISPSEFVPVFERNGFISKLDMYVWEEVCRFQHSRAVQNKEIIPISLNLSRVDFYNKNLYSDIISLLEKYELTPEYIKLEITESAYMDQPQELLDTISRFQKKGFKVLMDDFGSGYSSLNMLKDMSVDVLKIDMRFLESLDTSDRAGNILYSVVQMAKSIQMDVVAEGVETQKQYYMLADMGCNNIQGYFFYKPLEGEQYAKRLDEDAVHLDEKKWNKAKQILLVDGNEASRGEFCNLLSEDYRIVAVPDIQKAQEILNAEYDAYDMTVISVEKDSKDAVDLIRLIKNSRDYSDMPVLCSVAENSLRLLDQMYDAGVDDYLMRPYHRLFVLKRLKCILYRSWEIHR